MQLKFFVSEVVVTIPSLEVESMVTVAETMEPPELSPPDFQAGKQPAPFTMAALAAKDVTASQLDNEAIIFLLVCVGKICEGELI